MKRGMPVSFAVCARYSVKRRLIVAVNEGGTTEQLRPLEDARGFFVYINKLERGNQA